MTRRRHPAASDLILTLHHAALDPPPGAVDHWRGADPEALLAGKLPDGVVHLLPMIWRNLEAAGWDDGTMARLKGLARRTWLLNRTALTDLEAALTDLAAASIAPIMLGGPAMALADWGWSGDVKFRSLADAALLVSPADRERATAVLGRGGWSTGSPRQTARHTRLWHETEATSRDGFALRVVSVPSPWLEREAWWQSGSAVTVGSATAATLSATDAFLVTCIDGAFRPHRHPIWVADAHRILATGTVDPERCERIATEHRVADALTAAWRLLGDEFGESLPPGPEIASDHRHRPPDSPLQSDWAALRRVRAGRPAIHLAPAFLADRWGLEHARQVPAEAVRRLSRRFR